MVEHDTLVITDASFKFTKSYLLAIEVALQEEWLVFTSFAKECFPLLVVVRCYLYYQRSSSAIFEVLPSKITLTASNVSKFNYRRKSLWLLGFGISLKSYLMDS